MKLLLVILRAQDSDTVIHALIKSDFGVTHIASTGGFLRKGNATLLIATEEERVDQAIDLVRETSSPPENGQRRATVFVLNLEAFEKL